MAEVVQFDHDQLNGIETRFTEQAEKARAIERKVTEQMEVLKGGAWVGPNADKLFEVMESQLLPANKRLADALDKSSEVTRQVTKMMHDADEETKGFFPA